MKMVAFDSDFFLVLFPVFQVTISHHCFGNGLAPNRRQVSISTKAGLLYWHIYGSRSVDCLMMTFTDNATSYMVHSVTCIQAAVPPMAVTTRKLTYKNAMLFAEWRLKNHGFWLQTTHDDICSCRRDMKYIWNTFSYGLFNMLVI